MYDTLLHLFLQSPKSTTPQQSAYLFYRPLLLLFYTSHPPPATPLNPTHLLRCPSSPLIHHKTMHHLSLSLLQPPRAQPFLIRALLQILHLNPPTLPLAIPKNLIAVIAHFPVQRAPFFGAAHPASGDLRDINVCEFIAGAGVFVDGEGYCGPGDGFAGYPGNALLRGQVTEIVGERGKRGLGGTIARMESVSSLSFLFWGRFSESIWSVNL